MTTQQASAEFVRTVAEEARQIQEFIDKVKTRFMGTEVVWRQADKLKSQKATYEKQYGK